MYQHTDFIGLLYIYIYNIEKSWMGPYCQQRKFTRIIISKDVDTVNNFNLDNRSVI